MPIGLNILTLLRCFKVFILPILYCQLYIIFNVFLDVNDFLIVDKDAERKYKFQLKESLAKAKTKKLLDGYNVLVTPSVKPGPQEMKGSILLILLVFTYKVIELKTGFPCTINYYICNY